MIARLARKLLDNSVFKEAVQREVARQLPVEMERKHNRERAVVRLVYSSAFDRALDEKLSKAME